MPEEPYFVVSDKEHAVKILSVVYAGRNQEEHFKTNDEQ